jgi:hypothetical protein
MHRLSIHLFPIHPVPTSLFQGIPHTQGSAMAGCGKLEEEMTWQCSYNCQNYDWNTNINRLECNVVKISVFSIQVQVLVCLATGPQQ